MRARRLAIDAAVLLLMLLLLRTGYYLEASGPGLSSANAAEVTQWLNWSLQLTFGIWAITLVVCLMFDLRRLLRKPSAQLTQERAA